MAGPTPTPSGRMPVLFIGHGHPLNALEANPLSRALQALAGSLPRPVAILAISAHWYRRGTAVTANDRPPTIHDFGGFPQALFDVQYPAPGDPDLARRVVRLLGEERASLKEDWGLDHGTRTVLCHLFPRGRHSGGAVEHRRAADTAAAPRPGAGLAGGAG
jgi:4,5-DOPA dioxygenase extradiol